MRPASRSRTLPTATSWSVPTFTPIYEMEGNETSGLVMPWARCEVTGLRREEAGSRVADCALMRHRIGGVDVPITGPTGADRAPTAQRHVSALGAVAEPGRCAGLGRPRHVESRDAQTRRARHHNARIRPRLSLTGPNGHLACHAKPTVTEVVDESVRNRLRTGLDVELPIKSRLALGLSSHGRRRLVRHGMRAARRCSTEQRGRKHQAPDLHHRIMTDIHS